ncbi:hypothetical protein [Vacuolonema iberomarrocanum]|uniref:hypothetical protein n=1 Tax=Vacuolonema iberomarrocanum TaxID=3454632 RepID=UPI0019E4E90D|nr:hypothetical protein [filamentous cyanobacterium LEGE 07170]
MHDRQLTPFTQPKGTNATKKKDNKVRLSHDVLDKAQMIASEWGLKNARAAIEAVFRCYADEYLGKMPGGNRAIAFQPTWSPPKPQPKGAAAANCEALDVLDELLGA